MDDRLDIKFQHVITVILPHLEAEAEVINYLGDNVEIERPFIGIQRLTIKNVNTLRVVCSLKDIADKCLSFKEVKTKYGTAYILCKDFHVAEFIIKDFPLEFRDEILVEQFSQFGHVLNCTKLRCEEECTKFHKDVYNGDRKIIIVQRTEIPDMLLVEQHYVEICPVASLLICDLCKEIGHLCHSCKKNKCEKCNVSGHLTEFCTAALLNVPRSDTASVISSSPDEEVSFPASKIYTDICAHDDYSSCNEVVEYVPSSKEKIPEYIPTVKNYNNYTQTALISDVITDVNNAKEQSDKISVSSAAHPRSSSLGCRSQVDPSTSSKIPSNGIYFTHQEFFKFIKDLREPEFKDYFFDADHNGSFLDFVNCPLEKESRIILKCFRNPSKNGHLAFLLNSEGQKIDMPRGGKYQKLYLVYKVHLVWLYVAVYNVKFVRRFSAGEELKEFIQDCCKKIERDFEGLPAK